jgi:hypothetical protein
LDGINRINRISEDESGMKRFGYVHYHTQIRAKNAEQNVDGKRTTRVLPEDVHP